MNGVAAYVRISTKEQKQEGRHETQRERIKQWANRNGYENIRFFEDLAVSGQSKQRDGYADLMEMYKGYDVVVVRELSRFGRDPLTVMKDVEKIIQSDTDFVSLREDFDTSSAMGKAFVRIVAVINGMYSDLRREQAIRAAERRKDEGLHVGRPQKLDDGHMNEVYDLRRKGVSYSAIARIMEDKPNGPREISRETIRRYCNDADVEPAT